MGNIFSIDDPATQAQLGDPTVAIDPDWFIWSVGLAGRWRWLTLTVPFVLATIVGFAPVIDVLGPDYEDLELVSNTAFVLSMITGFTLTTVTLVGTCQSGGSGGSGVGPGHLLPLQVTAATLALLGAVSFGLCIACAGTVGMLILTFVMYLCFVYATLLTVSLRRWAHIRAIRRARIEELLRARAEELAQAAEDDLMRHLPEDHPRQDGGPWVAQAILDGLRSNWENGVTNAPVPLPENLIGPAPNLNEGHGIVEGQQGHDNDENPV